ncbi:MAG: conjugative transposon protein TraM [Bacteroidales bacterium]|jgi:conjugative transposon TraM protein|nr:conjugative transposon protein TraM [Bacteroidales bacterium]
MNQTENLQQNPKNSSEKKEEKKPLSPQEMQKRKKMIVFPALLLLFAGCMWLIFAPSSKEGQQAGTNGFNADIPLPKEDVIIEDKKTAYEQEQLRERQATQRRTIEDYAFLLGEKTENNVLDTGEEAPFETGNYYGTSPKKNNNSSIQSSASACRNINRQLGSFYEPSKPDTEREELSKKVEELTAQLETQQNARMSVSDQLALMERSYELSAQYMNNGNQEPVRQVVSAKKNTQKKTQITPVKRVSEQVVSGLQIEISDEEFMEMYTKPRNFGFYTATETSQMRDKNTIRACIHEEQTVMDGQNVRLRLLEPLQAENIIIPQNTLFTGTARVQGERLDIIISTLEYEGNIISVELLAYDSDGQKGLYVPASLERQAINEAVTNIGTGMGTNFTVNQNAGAAIVSDVTRSVLQGGSQYLSKKLRTAKIKLKANYQIMLYEKL